jgi:hypothetical protein
MVEPNFLIIGAARAGTTSLYSCLAQHPQIYMSPRKEPIFLLVKELTWRPTTHFLKEFRMK